MGCKRGYIVHFKVPIFIAQFIHHSFLNQPPNTLIFYQKCLFLHWQLLGIWTRWLSLLTVTLHSWVTSRYANIPLLSQIYNCCYSSDKPPQEVWTHKTIQNIGHQFVSLNFQDKQRHCQKYIWSNITKQQWNIVYETYEYLYITTLFITLAFIHKYNLGFRVSCFF